MLRNSQQEFRHVLSYRMSRPRGEVSLLNGAFRCSYNPLRNRVRLYRG